MTNPRPAGPPPASPVRPTAPKKVAPVESKGGGTPPGKGKKGSNAALIGYLISGGIVLIIVVAVAWMMLAGAGIGTPTDATTAPGRLKLIPMALDVSSFTKPGPETGNDAYDLYRGAIADAKAMCPKDSFVEIVQLAAKEQSPQKNAKFKPMLDKLVNAADAGFDRTRDLTFDEVRVDMKNWLEIQPEWRAIGRSLQYASMDLANEGKYDEAEKYARAELILGLRLWDRGVYVPYRSAGLGLISQSIGLFQSIFKRTKNDAKFAAVTEIYEQQFKPVSVKWTAKENACSRNVQFPSGDGWNLANNDEDVSWRLEGIMRLGVGRWLRNDRTTRAIDAYLQRRSNDADSRIAERAKEALAFTEADKNVIVLEEPRPE